MRYQIFKTFRLVRGFFKLAIHWQIIIALVLGLAFGLTASQMGWAQFTQDWIKPFGTIFINFLKMIAVPLILASLISGVASLNDVAQLSRIGGKTIAIYLATTVVAVSIGLYTLSLHDALPI